MALEFDAIRAESDNPTDLQEALRKACEECADELETWLAVNLEPLKELLSALRPKAEAYERVCKALGIENDILSHAERIKAEARLEGRRASLDYVSGVIAGCSKFGEDEVLKGCVEEEYERIAALEAQAKEKP